MNDFAKACRRALRDRLGTALSTHRTPRNPRARALAKVATMHWMDRKKKYPRDPRNLMKLSLK